ncbi:tannase/feruloyl esterase family alpha/beta hydrolase [Rhizobium helianthi]|uniref:Tannase/feruloyl esterase family alpha/beta hydrolase n=1 Tax=Rhizobium helianthi TaxID=1132695 RepID=A0ABW4M0L3_9HYPH
MKQAICTGVSFLTLLCMADAATAKTCEDALSNAQAVPGLVINEAVATPSTEGIPVAHCLIRGSTPERKGVDGKTYSIRFEIRLPNQWNGSMVHQFNGGNDGVVVPALGRLMGGDKKQNALTRGFAVISSNAGHDGEAYPEKGIAGGAAFGLDPEARLDYGYKAVATLQPLARAFIEKYYGKAVVHAYGVGGSNGGRHALMAASRMPDAFDGLLVGYPGFNLPKAAIQHAWDVQAWQSVNADLAKAFSRQDMELLAGAILSTCDTLDGVEDGLVSDADSCEAKFDPRTLQCKQEGTSGCLSEKQVAAVIKSHQGPVNSKGEALYSRWTWDPGMASMNWRTWKLESPVEAWGKRPIISVMGAASLAQIFTTPPVPVGGTPDDLVEFLAKFDFDKDAPKIFATSGKFKESAAEFMIPPSSDNPKLEAFRDAGNKMIVFHGEADPVFSVVDTINWYRKLNVNNANTASDFVRLYRIPGMPHGAGGPSFDDFDFFSPLVAWVEKGEAPQAVSAGISSENKEAGKLVGTKTIYCPYPQIAKASGIADAKDDARYRCE